MKRQLQVYKHDNWNQMNILINGKHIVVSELSSTFGETTYDFFTKSEMMAWAKKHFANEEPTELQRILQVFEQA
ncbi:MAG: hypothetical protein JWN30_2600 [Bacilli bacterium]|nr:hypothetical protein [Bacilli bacterium]